MGAGGSSLPSEYKQKIHAAFKIKNTEAWRNAEDFDDELEMRNELMNLRGVGKGIGRRPKKEVYRVRATDGEIVGSKKNAPRGDGANPLFKR